LATLVAEGATPDEVFAAVADGVAQILGLRRVEAVRYGADGTATVIGAAGDHPFAVGSTWNLDGPSIMEYVRRTGRPARIDDYSSLSGTVAAVARDSGIIAAIGAPIAVKGATWGAIVAISDTAEPIPEGAEGRLELFTELVATAVSNVQAQDDLRGLADEQAGLRRVATLGAEGATPHELFAGVASEVTQVLGVAGTLLDRYEPDGTAVTLAVAVEDDWEAARRIAYPGLRWPPDPGSLPALVLTTRHAARVDDYADLPGMAGDAARAAEVGSACAAPIVVGGTLWGLISVFSRKGRAALPADAESRLVAFTELLATAISNAQAGKDLRSIADEQAALRRVATLVAEGASADELFSGVATEVAQVLGVAGAQLDRYEPDRTAVVLASRCDPDWETLDTFLPVGRRLPPTPGSLTAAVQETERAARVDDYSYIPGEIGEISRAAGVGSACAAPILVDGKLWGAIRVLSRERELLPQDTEERLEGFTELVATAISNAQARDDLRGLADEQAALRRVATLVAGGTDSQSVFDAVCAETAQVVGATSVNLSHYTRDGANLTMAGWSLRDTHVPVGTRYPLTPDTIGGEIVRTRAPARKDSWDDAKSELAQLVRARGIRSSVGAPVVVEGQLWGALVAASDSDDTLPPGTELQLARFTELVATAVSNASARSELIASRTRIVVAADEARRRIERDLHDGTQQRLLALGLDLQRIQALLPEDRLDARAELERAENDLESVLEEVRELSRGLHPQLLSRGGLLRSLAALTRRSSIPVSLDVHLPERPPAPIETALYYAVAEALTNAIRHSHATAVSVTITSDDAGAPRTTTLDGRPVTANLYATIVDDGVGGAEPAIGSGLMGLVDRIEALGGRFELESPHGHGTRISIKLPLATSAAPVQ
jgi:signal transduction histidine kinase/putative methionine-R-sulfoxide reductase with GAF domain